MNDALVISQGSGQIKASVLDFDRLIDSIVAGLDSPHSQRAYKRGMRDFVGWYIAQGQPELNKTLVNSYRAFLMESGMGDASINQRLTSIRKLLSEASDNGWIDAVIALGISKVKGIKTTGVRAGNWLSIKQANALIKKPNISTLKGLRDRAVLVVLLGSGLRRAECASLRFDQLRFLDNRWLIADLKGKRNKLRTVPINATVKNALDAWADGARISDGFVFRSMQKGDRVNASGLRPRFVNEIVQSYAPDISAHDLRRTFAKIAYQNGAEITQIQIVLGHESLETTRRYLGVELDLADSPSDHVRLKL